MEPRTRFRWRIIPGYFLVLFGGLLVLCTGLRNLLALALQPDQMRPGTLGGMALLMGSGAIWMRAGRLTLKGRYWWALSTVAAGYFVGVGGASLLWPEQF